MRTTAPSSDRALQPAGVELRELEAVDELHQQELDPHLLDASDETTQVLALLGPLSRSWGRPSCLAPSSRP